MMHSIAAVRTEYGNSSFTRMAYSDGSVSRPGVARADSARHLHMGKQPLLSLWELLHIGRQPLLSLWELLALGMEVLDALSTIDDTRNIFYKTAFF
jgi:hypothetical protein